MSRRAARVRRLRRAYARKCIASLTWADDEEWRPARERCHPRQWVALSLLCWAIDFVGGDR